MLPGKVLRMTTVAAIEHPEGVSLAWDSRVSAGNEQWAIDDSKAFVNAGMAFLFTGTLRDLNIIKYAPLPTLDTWDCDRFVTNALVPAIKNALDAVGASWASNSQSRMDSALLAIVDGRVYAVESHFGWHRREDGIYTAGSGGDFARGALSAGAGIREAVEVAAKHDAKTGGLIHVTQAAALLKGEKA